MEKLNPRQAESKSTGSRYTALEEVTEVLEMYETGEGSEGQGEGPHDKKSTEEQASVGVQNGGSTLDKMMEDAEGVTISVSHANLMDMLQPRCNRGTTNRIRLVGPKGVPKKLKEKVLNDITNKLDIRPIMLKPERLGQDMMSANKIRRMEEIYNQPMEGLVT